MDQHRRRRLAAELQRVFYEDPPAIFIANQRHARALSRRFTPPEGAGDDILDTLWRWRQTDGLDTQ